MESPGRRWLALLTHPLVLGAVAFLGYAALVEIFYLVFELADLAGNPAPVATFFPPAGVAVAVFLGLPYARWPVVAGAIWAAEVTIDLYHGVGLRDCATWGVANAVEPMVGAWLVRRFIGTQERRHLASVRGLMLFLGSAVVVGPALGATIALLTVPAGEAGALVDFWVRWWVGDGIGVLVVAPMLLVLSDRRHQPPRPWGAPLFLLVGLLTALSLGPVPWTVHDRWVYLLLPALVGVGLLGGARATAGAVLVVGLAANVGTVLGYGPFVDQGSPFTGLVTAQLFVGTVAFAAVTVAVLRADVVRRDTAERLLRDQARTDLLTGIGNRRMLLEELGDSRTTRGLQPDDRIAVLLLDLDAFKQVNDTWGHAAGDHVLRTTADRLRSVTRSEDLVVRLGGDEFLVCMTRSASGDQVRAIAERWMSLLSEPIAVDEQSSVSVGASIGIAEGSWRDFDLDEFLRRADDDMYAVKRGPTDEPA